MYVLTIFYNIYGKIMLWLATTANWYISCTILLIIKKSGKNGVETYVTP